MAVGLSELNLRRVETFGARRVLGTCVALTGVVILIHDAESGGTQWSFLGDAMVLASNIGFALYIILQKPLGRRYGALTLTFLTFLLGSIIMTPLSSAAI